MLQYFVNKEIDIKFLGDSRRINLSIENWVFQYLDQRL
jgi:hypothetical protein